MEAGRKETELLRLLHQFEDDSYQDGLCGQPFEGLGDAARQSSMHGLLGLCEQLAAEHWKEGDTERSIQYA